MGVTDTIASTAVNLGLKYPSVARLTGLFNKDAKDMIKFLVEPLPNLDSNVLSVTGMTPAQLAQIESGQKLSDSDASSLPFAAIYQEVYAAAKQDIAKGLPGLKSQSQTDLANDPVVLREGARKIAYAITSTIQENMPEGMSMHYAGAAFGDTWKKAAEKFDSTKRPEPFKDPIGWVSSLVGQTWDFVSTLVGGVFNIKTNATNLANKDAAEKADKIALDIGGKLTVMGMSQDAVGDAMVAAYEKIRQKAEPSFKVEDKNKAKKDFVGRLQVEQRAAINRSTLDTTEGNIKTTLQEQPLGEKTADPKRYEGVSGTAKQIKDWLAGAGAYAGTTAVKDSIYTADLSAYGLSAFSLQGFKTGLATMFSLSKRGEMESLKNAIQKDPNFVVGFHNENGELFDPSKLSSDDKLPKTPIISITDKRQPDAPAKLFYFQKPGVFNLDTLDRAVMGAGQVATTILAGEVVGGVALAGNLLRGGSTAQTAAAVASDAAATAANASRLSRAASLAKTETKLIAGGTVTAVGMDAVSKNLGGYSNEIEYGEAFKTALTTGTAAGIVGKSLSKATVSIPSASLGGMLRTVNEGVAFTKEQLAEFAKNAINPDNWRKAVAPTLTLVTKKRVLIPATLYGAHQLVAASDEEETGQIKPPATPNEARPPSSAERSTSATQ